MKTHIVHFWSLIFGLILFSSCTKDSNPEILTFSFEKPANNSKVYITDAGEPIWHDNDSICIGDHKGTPIHYTQDGEAYILTTEIQNSDYYQDQLFNGYPYIAVLGDGAFGRQGGTNGTQLIGVAKVKESHRYRRGETFPGSGVLKEKVYAPMMGCITQGPDNHFHMKNLAGIIRFRLRVNSNDPITVHSIRIDCDKVIAGPLKCIWNASTNDIGTISQNPGTYTYTELTDINQEITNTTTPQALCHIPVIPVTNAKCTVTIECSSRSQGEMTFQKTQRDGHLLTIARNQIITLAATLDDGSWTVTTPAKPTFGTHYFKSGKGATYVQIAPGNLQYNPGNGGPYRFASPQYATIGTGNNNIADDKSTMGWIDLFGYHSGANASQDSNNIAHAPNNSSFENGDFVPYEIIDNGKTYYLPSDKEIRYILNQRTYLEYQWVHARIYRTNSQQVYGLIIFPDDFVLPNGITAITSPNIQSTTYICSEADWNALETAGCVFLPATGYRTNASTTVDGTGRYWTSTRTYNSNTKKLTKVSCLIVYGSDIQFASSDFYIGRSIRLVATCPANSTKKK